MSQNITRVGIDLAKNIFQICAVDKYGKVIFNKTVKRTELKSFIANCLLPLSGVHRLEGVHNMGGVQ